MLLMVGVEAVNGLSEFGFRHVEVWAASEGRGALAALGVEHAEAALGTVRQVPAVLPLHRLGTLLHLQQSSVMMTWDRCV